MSLPDIYKDIAKLQEYIKAAPEDELISQGAQRAFQLFHEMANRVPAYQNFLRQSNFDVSGIKNVHDFKHIVTVDKDNYLRQNTRKNLCWDGRFSDKSWVISTTSGSTGEPFYFPRQSEQDRQYAISAELYFRENFAIGDKSTLYIIAFPMGAWIGGVFTYEAAKQVAEKGYNLSIITPGISKMEVIKAVKNLGSDFDQVIIGAYAPFLKDILDEGEAEGIDWKQYNLGFIFSAEAFSEEFRDYVAKKTGLKDIYRSTLNHYGTVDQGTLAHETPLAILVRRLAIAKPELYAELFSNAAKLPTLAQFDPNMFYFESVDGNIYCTSESGFPLVRYDLKDHGGVITKSEVFGLFEKHGIDLMQEAKDAGIADTIWNWPFVYVYERSDFSVSFFAFQIYPETLKKALLHSDLQDHLTGKFSMTVRYDNEGQQIFEVNVELKPGNNTDNTELTVQIADIISAALIRENSEYRKTSEEYGLDRVRPRIVLWPYEHPEHFKPGGKQKWVKKL